jgi:hypothetical protein
MYEFDGVHMNLYDYFGLSPAVANRDEVSKLQKVYNWAMGKQRDIGKAMRKIEALANRVGKSKIGYEELVHIYNHIKVRELL